MTPELGYAATVAALVLAVYGSGAAALSAVHGRMDLRRSAERAAIGVSMLVVGSAWTVSLWTGGTTMVGRSGAGAGMSGTITTGAGTGSGAG